MKRKIVSLLLCLSLCLPLLPAALADGEEGTAMAAQEQETERSLFFPRSSYPYGPMGMEEHLYHGDDMETRVLLPQQYNDIRQVSVEPSRFLVEKIIAVDLQVGGRTCRYGLVDDYGQFILPEEYTDCKRGRENEDLLAFAMDGKYAYYSLSQEKFITGFDYDTAQGFDELGIVGVHISYDENGVPSKTLYGAVNRQGELVIPLEYSLLDVYRYNGSFILAHKGETYGDPDPQVRMGAFDYTGKPLRACVYPNSQLFSAALCMDVPLRASGEAKLKEEELSITWLPQYDRVMYEPETARLGYRIGTEGGIAHLDGTDITGPVYHYGPSYYSFDGMGWCAYDYDTEETIYLDPDGNILPEKPTEKQPVPYLYDEIYGFLLTDGQGNALFPKVEGEHYDVAPWDAGEGLYGFVRNGKVGFADAAGRVVIEPQYTYSPYHSRGFDYCFLVNGLAPIYQEGGGRGFIDVKGNWYDRWDLGILSADEGPNGKYGYRDQDWNLVIPYLFDNVGEFEKGYALVRRDGVYGLLKDPTVENAAVEPSLVPTSDTAFTDVPAGSWFEQGVKTSSEKGIMVGTGNGLFSPEAELTHAECLTLALRLYDLQRGGDGTLEKAPEDWGKCTLTIADGTTWIRWGEHLQNPSFDRSGYFNGKNQAPRYYVLAPGETVTEREAWAMSHEGRATLTIAGTAYEGTVTRGDAGNEGPCLLFQPDEPGILGDIDAFDTTRPSPDKWYRDAAYTAGKWGLSEASGFGGMLSLLLGGNQWSSRGHFAQALAVAAGELDKLFSVEALPDLTRNGHEDIYTLYEAGILTGTDESGTFQQNKTLTRAEAAVMVSRVLDPALRIGAGKTPETQPGQLPAAPGMTTDQVEVVINRNLEKPFTTYAAAVEKLRSGMGYSNERTFDTDTCTIFCYDLGGFMNAPLDYLRVVYKAGGTYPEGTILDLPFTTDRGWHVNTRTDSMTLSGDGKTFTYTYTFEEIGNLGNYGNPVQAGGTYTYVFDVPSGTVTLTQPVLRTVTYAQALEQVTQEEGHTVEKIIKGAGVTAVLRYSLLKGRDSAKSYSIYLVYNSGGLKKEGKVDLEQLPVTASDGLYADRAPDHMFFSKDGRSFFYTYYYSPHDGAPYTSIIDLEQGYHSSGHLPTVVELLSNRATVDKRVDGPAATALLVYDEHDGAKDYILYLINKETGGAWPALLPSTYVGAADDGSVYSPTDRAPDSISFSADGSILTYVYKFAQPLKKDGTVYHEAGTYTYKVNVTTGELSVAHT